MESGEVNVKSGTSDSRSPSRAEPDVSYAEVNFKNPSAPRVRTDRDGLKSTYSDLQFRKEEPRIIEDEDPPIASGHGGLSTTAQTAAQERKSKVKIGNRPYRLICVLCLVLFALIVIVVVVSILVQVCSQGWIRNEGNCYFLSTFNISYNESRQHCSNSDSKLLEINSAEEENFVSKAVHDQSISYWIGKCKDGKAALNVQYRTYRGESECGVCTLMTALKPCDQVHTRFICEKSSTL